MLQIRRADRTRVMTQLRDAGVHGYASFIGAPNASDDLRITAQGKTVFAEDAQVDYGPTYKGTGYGFIDMMLKMHRKMVSTHHVMTNILIKLNEDGTKAAAEAYMYAACKYRNGMVVVARCRDIDLWEKRDGKWLVVKRTVAGDNTMILHPDFAPDYNNGRDKVKDPSYDYFETIE